jgi:hypothetical protein
MSRIKTFFNNKNRVLGAGVGLVFTLSLLLYVLNSSSAVPLQISPSATTPKLLRSITVAGIGINPSQFNIKDYSSYRFDFISATSTASEMVKIDKVALLNESSQVIDVYTKEMFALNLASAQPTLIIPRLGARFGAFIKDAHNARVNVALLDVNGDVLFGQGFPFSDGYGIALVKTPQGAPATDIAISTLLTPKSCTLYAESTKKKIVTISKENTKSPIISLKKIPKDVKSVYVECSLLDNSIVTSAPLEF